jgi:hypothetical protein
VTWNHYENIANTIKAFAEVRTRDKIFRKFDTREIADILAVRNHGFQQVELNDATQANVTSRARKLQRQRGSPGTSADNRYRLGSCVAY